MSKKIALIGSAPSSIALAPYNDPSWQIWACSPGAVPHLRRVDAFFELHRWEPGKPWFQNDYIGFMASLPCPVYMIEPVPVIPKSEAYPKDAMLAKWGPYFFSSSLSWMFALAIEQGATEIGLWGVDMSAKEEYIAQRSACHFWIDTAKRLGIKVTLPPESDLARPFPLYGFCEVDPMHIKLLARKAELDARVADCARREQEAQHERLFLLGALDDVNYMLNIWIADPKTPEAIYSQPASPAKPPVETKVASLNNSGTNLSARPRKGMGANGTHPEA